MADPATLPPAVGRAILESLGQGVAVFAPDGRLLYVNSLARRLANGAPYHSLKRQLLAQGARVVALDGGDAPLGEAVFVSAGTEASTLAEQERRVILDTLASTRGRLVEAARRLGISRTTLWRRLKTYGVTPRAGVPH
jgi:transcriptional regulator of acetoin/glycerol metabolism